MKLENGFREYSLDDTYNRLLSILDNADIEIEVTSERRLPNIYSSRVQLKKIPMFGTNGKGVTEQASIVSGLAELLERLQTFALYKYRVPLTKIRSEKGFCYSPDERFMDITMYDIDIKESLRKHNELLTDAEKDKAQVLHLPYRSLLTDIELYMPAYVTDICYATNGLASGNTHEEAYIQAICEVFERYANKSVLETNQILPTISLETVFKNNEQLKALYEELLKTKDCDILFKDVSLGLSIPVIMLVFIDHSIGKYFVKFASHPVFSVAVTRLLTELLQGRRLTARALWLQEFELSTAHNQLLNYNQIMRSGDGQYPYHIFLENNMKPDMSVWLPDVQATTNNMLMFLMEIIKQNGWDVYVRNVSFLGFPTCQAIIPGVSEIYEKKMLELESEFLKMKQYFAAWEALDEVQSKELISYIAKHVNPEKNLLSYFGFLVDRNTRSAQFPSVEFLVALSMKYGLLEDALYYLKTYQQQNNIVCKILKHILKIKLMEKGGGDSFDTIRALYAIYKHDDIQRAVRIVEEPNKYITSLTEGVNERYETELLKLHKKLQDYMSCKNGVLL